MENIIKKAIEGGYKCCDRDEPFSLEKHLIANFKEEILDPKFFQALGKACGWSSTKSMYNCMNPKCTYFSDPDMESVLDGFCSTCGHKRTEFKKDFKEWLVKGISFHEINLTSGWSAAVEYLQGVTK